MATNDRNEKLIQSFFRGTKSVSQLQCNEVARNIFGRDGVTEPIGAQGSLSYTLLCTRKTECILSFRRQGSTIDSGVIHAAKSIHGDLVPDAHYCGQVGDGSEVLTLYKMPRLPGERLMEVYPKVAEFTEDQQVKSATLYRELARYFARTWLKPQPLSAEALKEDEATVRRKISILRDSGDYPYLDNILSKIERVLPDVYAPGWPTVLNHGDFSEGNMLVDPETYAITGIIDWARSSVRPFGMDLSTLFANFAVFSFDGDNVTAYEVAPRHEELFWAEFWDVTGIPDAERSKIRRTAELVAKLDVICTFAFNMTLGGVFTDQPLVINEPIMRGWFGNEPPEDDAGSFTVEARGGRA
ncbi:hypothetical protein GGR56DRAFT_320638 [Xylariaceae sp. FL0804]|nr:hypothetical protein GGR56DRAFT_320638 [Xylariaceae sp. FL0804]